MLAALGEHAAPESLTGPQARTMCKAFVNRSKAVQGAWLPSLAFLGRTGSNMKESFMRAAGSHSSSLWVWSEACRACMPRIGQVSSGRT